MSAAGKSTQEPDAAEEATFEPTRRQWVGYWCMIVQQTQNAFNDKAAQFILIPLAAAVGFALPMGGGADFGVESAAGLMIALPFVLFAPLAGWVSDRFSKRNVMLAMAMMQTGVLCWICVGVWMGNLWMALAGFFALAVQSAFFSPAKIGINKELVGSRHLGFAAGIQQMMAVLAILIGQVTAGWWFDKRYVALGAESSAAWQAAFGPLCLLTAFSVPAVVMAWVVPRVRAQGHEPFSAKLAFCHFRDLGELWREAGMRRASFGVAFFWGFAAYLNLWSVKLAKEITGGEAGFGTLSSTYMAAASIGMVLGFAVASWLLRKRIELGWVPLAGASMATGAFALAFVDPANVLFLVGLGTLAFAGAVFLAPLNAWMQDHYPPDKRGELQSAVNLQDCFAGILAVFVIALLEMATKSAGIDAVVGLRGQLWFVALACAGITLLVIRLLPGDFLRLLLLAILRSVYRIRVVHPERVPATGGALLLPNHITFADAFFLSAACPRNVRFVMDETFMAHRWIRLSAKIFGTVTIRRDQPLEAIRAVIAALGNGEVVCLFPEGQLTRTGGLCQLRRGFELIARKAGHPLIPMWCDGAWGSVFSFERGRFFSKIPYQIPYGLVVAFGRPIASSGVDAVTMREAMLRASCEAVARRFAGRGWTRRMPRNSAPAQTSAMFRNATAGTRRRYWINAHQISQVNALQRREALHILAHDPVPAALPSIVIAWVEMFGGRLMIHDAVPAEPDGAWVGGEVTRDALAGARTGAGLRFFDFAYPAGNDRATHSLPCLAIDGMVVAMSMPDPPRPKPESEFQPGNKPGSCGMLLPGWLCLTEPGGTLRAIGPAAPVGGIRLDSASHIDDESFLFFQPPS